LYQSCVADVSRPKKGYLASAHRDWFGLVPRTLPSRALPGVVFDRILMVLDDAKIRLDMQAAYRAPLQRDDVVHDMQPQ